MTHLAFFIPALVLAAIAGALIYIYRKHRLKRFILLAGIVLLVAALVLVPVAMWKSYKLKFMLQAVPDALKVKTVSYQNEESWGFGPGGNEAGIRFYPLPEDVARKVSSGGTKYLEQLPPNVDQQRRRWRGRYERWSETPIEGDDWKVNPKTGLLNVINYICAYGFCIDIPPEQLKQANEIVSKPGSFYARGRIGIIVVSPEQKLVLYFYNG